MKKKIWIPIIAVVVLLAVLFVPIPQGSYDDGGTREWTALTYKIVDWNRISNNGTYEKTRIYWGKDKNKSIDELWDMEWEDAEYSFVATVLEINGDSVLVEPDEGQSEAGSSDKISFSFKDMDIGAKVGDRVKVTHTGEIMETYPAQINIVKWEICDSLTKEQAATYGKEVPELNIIYGNETYKAMKGTHSWTWAGDDGVLQAIAADSAHPTAMLEHMPEIKFFVSTISSIDPRSAILKFNVAPKEVNVQAWQISDDGSPAAESVGLDVVPYTEDGTGQQYVLTLLEKPHIYEITARWEAEDKTGGTVTYCFYTAKNPLMEYNTNN